MRRGRILVLAVLFLLIVISGLGLAVVLFFPQILTGGAGAGPTEAPTEPVALVTATPASVISIIRAVQAIDRGAIIPTEAIGAVNWPTELAPSTIITDPAQIVGKRARYLIMPEEPVLKSMIVMSLAELSPTGSEAAAQIPAGYLALSIPYDRLNGVAYGIRDGDHVTVLVSLGLVSIDEDFQTVLPNNSSSIQSIGDTNDVWAELKGLPVGKYAEVEAAGGGTKYMYAYPSEPQRARLVTQQLVRDATVLHVGEFSYLRQYGVAALPTATPDPQATPEPTCVPAPTPLPPDIITLIVSPQDALALNYFNRLKETYPTGVQITLALRAAGDINLADTQNVTMQYIFDSYNIKFPEALEYGVVGVPPTGNSSTGP